MTSKLATAMREKRERERAKERERERERRTDGRTDGLMERIIADVGGLLKWGPLTKRK